MNQDPVRRGRPLVFPRDHGAHLGSRIEWWYLTGWLLPQASPSGSGTPDAAQGTGEADDVRRVGFQVTFFRSATGKGEGLLSRFAPRHLLFAHAALSDLATRRHEHGQRLARWSGQADATLRDRALLHDADIAVGGWQLRRDVRPDATRSASTDTGAGGPDVPWLARVDTSAFTLDLILRPTQPLLLQGEQGWSRKGPQPAQASHYVSLPQLQVAGRLTRPGVARGSAQPVAGRAWFDHEWSDELLHPQAVGWDWIGMNLADGSALTAFVLRRADGSALWAGGSLRNAAGALRVFEADEVRWQPGRTWRSPVTGASYPVQWTLQTPAGPFMVQALADAQELDNRSSIGTAYWEGLSALLDAKGRRVGLGYLEMTGYSGRLVV